MENKKKLSVGDIIGIACGVLLLLEILYFAFFGGMGPKAGVSNSQIPEGAQVLTGTANGRNDTVKVKVVADENGIYQIKVLSNKETSGIGSYAVSLMPKNICDSQNLSVDAVSGATITSDAIREAVSNALLSGGLSPYKFGGVRVIVNDNADKVETGTKVTVLTAKDWEEQYPEVYASYMLNEENDEVVDYLEEYPMLKTFYDGYGFAKSYGSARGHYYDVNDLLDTGRPHALANCFTCKTPDFTSKVNAEGDSVYAMAFEDIQQEINEPISCYNCHANDPSTVTVTHTYLTDAVGEDFENIDAADLACGQCHVEYYFDPETKATTLPYSNLDTMNPDSILEYYKEMGFSDFTSPNTGVQQIKVQHPELETFLGEGSQHRNKYTCADCHMGDAVSEDGTTYKVHNLTSPLENDALIKSECSTCHEDLVGQIRELQAEVEDRTNEVADELLVLTDKLAAEVASGNMSEDELNEVRGLARDAQFYWDFVFVENSEGAHNSKLTYQCLDKSEALINEALAKLG